MDLGRSLKIKTGACTRLVKETKTYFLETEREQSKLEKMRSDSAEEHDLKQQQGVVDESRQMIVECSKRLAATVTDLQAIVDEARTASGQDLTAELQAASDALSQAQQFLQSDQLQ